MSKKLTTALVVFFVLATSLLILDMGRMAVSVGEATPPQCVWIHFEDGSSAYRPNPDLKVWEPSAECLP